MTTAKAARLDRRCSAPARGATVASNSRHRHLRPPAERAAVERRLKVTTDGHHRFMGLGEGQAARPCDWRPAEYWKPGTRVTLRAGLGCGLQRPPLFATAAPLTFTIGPEWR